MLPAVAALACLLAVPGSANAAKGMEVAIADNAIFLYRVNYDPAKAFRQTARLRVTRMRVQMTWANVLRGQAKRKKQPKKPRYYFGRFDDVIDGAAAHGIRVQLLVSGPAPAYATSNRRIGVVRPSPSKYRRFMRDVAKHFKGRVDRYSVWNEPNHKSWLQPMRKSGLLYRKLYLAGYRAVKSVDPKAKVLIGETAPYRRGDNSLEPLRFLRQAACVTKRYRPHRKCRRAAPAPGGALRADGYAHHPYDFLHKPTHRYPGADNVTIGTLGRLTGALDRLRRAGALRGSRKKLRLYLSEFGYFVRGEWSVGEKRRAKYLRQAYSLALRNKRVAQLLQYGLVSPPARYPGSFFDLSLVKRNGKPRPSYRALRQWAAKAAKRKKIKRARGPICLRGGRPSADRKRREGPCGKPPPGQPPGGLPPGGEPPPEPPFPPLPLPR